MASEEKDSLDKEALKESIVSCFAALTEKLEEARSEFVQNTDAVLGLVQVISTEPKLTRLQLSAFDLLRSIGRAKLAKKKILRDCFTNNSINFVQRISK